VAKTEGSTVTEPEAKARAVELSRRGYPAPNPHVGCVLVREGRIVGEGWHEFAGGPHAEAMALAMAGNRAKGADAYVTLEPCNHFGRTPPCSLALVEAGVRRVVIGSPDPNPQASGGADRLLDSAVAVEFDTEFRRMAEPANRRFLFALAHGRPEIVIKAATSLDGRIALPSGESRWITGIEARRRAHQLRAECGAVLVGRRTVEADNPRLTIRDLDVRNQPLRIVLDPRNALDPAANVFDNAAETWHVTGPIDLSALMGRLAERGHTGLLVEGGGKTIASFIQARLADRLALFQAPVILGDGPAWVQGLHLPDLATAPRIVVETSEDVGPDRLVQGAFVW